MRLILIACAVGALGGVVRLWQPAMAYWFNMAGIVLFVSGVLSWLSDGKRRARNENDDSSMTFTSTRCDTTDSCGSDSGGCDGGGD